MREEQGMRLYENCEVVVDGTRTIDELVQAVMKQLHTTTHFQEKLQ